MTATLFWFGFALGLFVGWRFHVFYTTNMLMQGVKERVSSRHTSQPPRAPPKER